MSTRRPAYGYGGPKEPRGGRYQQYYDEEEEPRAIIRRETGSGFGRPRSSVGPPRSQQPYDEEEDDGRAYRRNPGSQSSRSGRGFEQVPRGASRPSRSQREPFFAKREGRVPAVGETASTITRQLQAADREVLTWLRSEGEVPTLVAGVIKIVENIEERSRVESYNGYSGNTWEADDPISNSVKEKTQELFQRLTELSAFLEKPSNSFVDELAEEFYLLFSVMHVLLLNTEIPALCQKQIAEIMAAAACSAMEHGKPHVVLACTTDHLRDAQNDLVLLAFQHVLFKIINSDVDGQKLFGTAHRILDAQMEILETRSDEDTAISAITIIGVISVRHPQAFKTRFGDLMDLFFGWYVDAAPSDRVFDACIATFGLFRAKFKQELDFALKMSRQFTAEMDEAVKAYRRAVASSPEAHQQQSLFLAFLQLSSLIIHAISERIRGVPRSPADGGAQQVVKANVKAVLKSFNQILQASDPGFVTFSLRVNKALVVIVNALGNECLFISSLLFLHARMQQTAASRIFNVLLLQGPFVRSIFELIAAILRATGHDFPLDAAKDLLGPNSIVFAAARSLQFLDVLKTVLEAVISSAQPAVRDHILKTFGNDYRRIMQNIAVLRTNPDFNDKLVRSHTLDGVIRHTSRKPFTEALLDPAKTLTESDPLMKTKASYENNATQLCPEGAEESPAPEEVMGLLNTETLGQFYREKGMLHVLIIELCLSMDQPFEQEFIDGCYKILVKDMDPDWVTQFPELVVAHIYVAKAMWQKKCAALVVKELMSSTGGIVSIPVSDRELIRDTLLFLDKMLTAEDAYLTLDLVLEWANDALRTLIAFKAPLSSLGIESEYLKIIADFFFIACCGDHHNRTFAVNTLYDLYQSQWAVLRKTINRDVFEVLLFHTQSSCKETVLLAETVIHKASLQSVLAYKYDAYEENPSLLQMGLTDRKGIPSLDIGGFFEVLPHEWIRCLPLQCNVRMWKRFLFRSLGLGKGDTKLGATFLRELLNVDKKIYLELSQPLKAVCISEEWVRLTTDNSALSFFSIATEVATSVCHQRMGGIFSTTESLVALVETLFQAYVPVVFDHNAFMHKTLLDLYIAMKDAALDIADDWEELRRLGVETRLDENVETETAVNSNAKKITEKRRIYSRTGGITAQDVSGVRIDWFEEQYQLQRIFMFAEILEKSLERMIHGSGFYASALSDDEWAKHMQIVKSQYRTEEHLDKAKTTLKRLRSQMIRIALYRNDDHTIIRLGYPALLEVLQKETAEGLNVEQLALKTMWALVRHNSSHLVDRLLEAQETSSVDSGISEVSFAAARCMAEDRFDHALAELLPERPDLSEESVNKLDDLEQDLMSDCLAKLNNWKELSNVFKSVEHATQRSEEMMLFAKYANGDTFSYDLVEDTKQIRGMLHGGFTSRVDGAEVVAFAQQMHSDELVKEALESLEMLNRSIGLQGFLKVEPRAAIIRHTLERMLTDEVNADQVSSFPLTSSPALPVERLNIDARHTLCRWLRGNHTFSVGSDTAVSWDLELYRSLVKFGSRTENPTIVYGYLNDYFSAEKVVVPESSEDHSHGALLASLLNRASKSSTSCRDLDLIRLGSKFLSDYGHDQGPSVALNLIKQTCLQAFRLIEELPDDAGNCLIQVSKNLKDIDGLHCSSFGWAADEGESDFSALVDDAVTELRVHMQNLYEQSGFSPGLFVDNSSVVGFVAPHERISGLLAELAYEAHCIEGVYTKPALRFGNWCYDQAFQMLAYLSRWKPEEFIIELGNARSDLDFTTLTPGLAASILSAFMESLPVRTNRLEMKAIIDTLKGSLQPFDSAIAAELAKDSFIAPEISAAVLDYCQHYHAGVMEFFVQAAHVYFVYLRNPMSLDHSMVVVTRLLELLTAFPETLHDIWAEEVVKSDIRAWEGFSTQLFGRLHHPNVLVVNCVIQVLVWLSETYPADLLYPLAVGNLFAQGSNIGGGICCPNIITAQRGSMKSSYDNLLHFLHPKLGQILQTAAEFSTEIQRISLLWEERWLFYLLSHQTSIKKELKMAIKDGLAGYNKRLKQSDSVESLDIDESVTEEIAFTGPYSSDLVMGTDDKLQDDFFDPVIGELAGVIEGDRSPEREALVVHSREGTPDVSEPLREEADDDVRKEEKNYLRFPLHETAPWTDMFDYECYKESVQSVVHRLQSLIQVCSLNPETIVEKDFVASFLPRIASAVVTISDPSYTTEFDEEVLWGPFAQIITELEERQGVTRKGGLSLTDISGIRELISRNGQLPMPGWSVGSETPVLIEDIENFVEILPTKTKPKKLVFRGTDGYKHVYLCKGLEDLAQDARIMQFLNVSNTLLNREFKHAKSATRIRTYSVIPFGPRSGLIQWVDGSTSLLSLYRNHLERETFLERQIFAVNEDNFVEIPVYGQTKEKDDQLPEKVTFRVTEDELQELYEVAQETKYERQSEKANEPEGAFVTPPVATDGANVDPFEKWLDSDDEFSPTECVESYYATLLKKNKNDLQKLNRKNDIQPVRVHPHIHELYMSYLVRSLRKDSSIDWEKFRLLERNRIKDVGVEHLKNALTGLVQATPSDLLAREIWFACSSSEEWWMVTQSYTRSLAITSILGYVIGLGDRHPDNVLIDYHTGEVVHVDYNVSFEKGHRLSIPERVPYRLTQNLVKALGPDSVKGAFRDVALRTLLALRRNQPTLSLLMGSYITDPMVDWSTDKSDVFGLNPCKSESDIDDGAQKEEKAEAFGLKVWNRLREKLLGQDGVDGVRLDVPDQVDRTIEMATDLTNLARMFEGWVAWL